MPSVEERLTQLGLQLPAPPAAVGAYVPAMRTGNLIVTSGQLPFVGKEVAYCGKVGADLDAEAGAKAAKLCILNALAQVKALAGDFSKVRQIVRLEGYVQSAPGFTGQPQVLNGGSLLLYELFGEAGRHARAAVGVSELPLNAAVEIALWVEVAP